MQDEYVVLGKFRGSFYTEQGNVLEFSKGFPVDSIHAVKIYKGELTSVKFEENYRPDHYRKLSSFVLQNVPNIVIESDKETPFSGKRAYNLSDLIIIDPKVVRTYDINGKTYGEIESDAYGVTERYPLLNKLDPDEQPPRPPLVDENYDRSSGKSEIYSDNNSNFSPLPINPIEPITPPPSDGFRSYFSGCLANFWLILGIILFVMFLISVFGKLQSMEDQCVIKEKALLARNDEQRLLDSIKISYDKNFELVMGNSFKVYFYRNSADFELSAKSNIQRLYSIITGYEDKQFIIEGYHSGKSIENVPEIDKRRAEHLRDTLIQMGVPPSSLSIEMKGDKPLLDPLSRLSKTYVTGGAYLEYNQNMRVEVRWNKP